MSITTLQNAHKVVLQIYIGLNILVLYVDTLFVTAT